MLFSVNKALINRLRNNNINSGFAVNLSILDFLRRIGNNLVTFSLCCHCNEFSSCSLTLTKTTKPFYWCMFL